jgi:hypothetical protein
MGTFGGGVVFMFFLAKENRFCGKFRFSAKRLIFQLLSASWDSELLFFGFASVLKNQAKMMISRSRVVSFLPGQRPCREKWRSPFSELSDIFAVIPAKKLKLILPV